MSKINVNSLCGKDDFFSREYNYFKQVVNGTRNFNHDECFKYNTPRTIFFICISSGYINGIKFLLGNKLFVISDSDISVIFSNFANNRYNINNEYEMMEYLLGFENFLSHANIHKYECPKYLELIEKYEYMNIPKEPN